MKGTGFYIIELPIFTNKNGKPKEKGVTFQHKNGCKDWADCLTCPKPDCDWHPYPKPKKDRR